MEKENKKIITIEDIERKNKEEEMNNKQGEFFGFLDGLNRKMKEERSRMESQRKELKKKRPLWKKIVENLIILSIMLFAINLLLGSVWLFVKLIKYFVGLV